MISKPRLKTVGQLANEPGYEWLTETALRHHIFLAEDRYSSSGELIAGNGLASAIIRLGRRVLIDVDAFDRWLDGHRMAACLSE